VSGRNLRIRMTTTPLAYVAAFAGLVGAHSQARLVSDVATIRAGEPFTVGLHITLDAGWRTPWKNAGDVGNGLIATWTLPAGFTADSFAYPIPERIANPPVTSYGYFNEVVILATVTPPKDLVPGRSVELRLAADYVICGHTCIPISAERTLELPVHDGPATPSGEASLIARFAARLPVQNVQWTTRAARTESGFTLAVRPPPNWEGSLNGAYFFPADPKLLDHAAPQQVERTADGEYRVALTRSAFLNEKPKRIEGILVLPEGSAFDVNGQRGLVINAALLDVSS
jgi:DsbC/DsbD-like thiol-disulfide interchange protein